VNAGDTFVLSAQGAHLCIVAAGPCQHGNILFVRVTSDHPSKDRTCILQPGDHPFIRHTSLIHYADAKVVDDRRLADAIRAGQVQMRTPVNAVVLRDIRCGFSASLHALPIHVNFVVGPCRC
jgi:hypothetical protein